MLNEPSDRLDEADRLDEDHQRVATAMEHDLTEKVSRLSEHPSLVQPRLVELRQYLFDVSHGIPDLCKRDHKTRRRVLFGMGQIVVAINSLPRERSFISRDFRRSMQWMFRCMGRSLPADHLDPHIMECTRSLRETKILPHGMLS